MKNVIELPGPVIVNRAVHSMAVIVIVLFAFHFARLSGFTPKGIAVALAVAALAAASLALKRTVEIDPGARRIVKSVRIGKLALGSTWIDVTGISWSAVRVDLPDLVVEAGNPAYETIEILRFRNAFGGRETQAAAASKTLAEALRIEDRGMGAIG